MGLEVPSSYCALKKALCLGFLNLKGTSIVSRNVLWMSTRNVYVNVAWRPAQAGMLVFLLQYGLCEDRDHMDVEQREDGRVSMSELRSGVWTGPRKYPVRTAEALAQHRATWLPRAGMNAGVENTKAMKGKEAQCWGIWKQTIFYFITFELLTL